jgi:hypothetical protein
MENSTTAAGATSTLSAIDRQCHDWARSAFYCAEQLARGAAGPNTLYGFSIRIPALANRIIAMRTAELAQINAQMWLAIGRMELPMLRDEYWRAFYLCGRQTTDANQCYRDMLALEMERRGELFGSANAPVVAELAVAQEAQS